MRLIILMAFLSVSFSAFAQETPDCDPASIRADIELGETLEELQAAYIALGAALAECNGLYFAGQGQQTFSAELSGTYIVHMSAIGGDGHAGVKFIPVNNPDDYEYETQDVGDGSVVFTFNEGKYLIEGKSYGVDSWVFWLEQQ